ncbi:MAG: hydrogenase 3 maturation endopeptidase HyCI [Candidatus Omnitrophica bacterium]|nr:hydrogenase 3 maturation endopeptidase HyCI [Candidatus Omnitrophota bacterium]MBU1870092.1 hydrogenase 3 maturation endopeptidase HyCI [Candidatus Omnitrophota bacterium]
MDDLEHLQVHLKGKALILGIGNSLRSDDAFGSLLASRIKGKVPHIVYDAGPNPENYLGKIIKDKPDTVVIIDAVDFGGKPGEFRVLEADELKTTNLFSTHNASISLTINYLQGNFKVDIIILILQPKSIVFGDGLSVEVEESLNKLERWFGEQASKT